MTRTAINLESQHRFIENKLCEEYFFAHPPHEFSGLGAVGDAHMVKRTVNKNKSH